MKLYEASPVGVTSLGIKIPCTRDGPTARAQRVATSAESTPPDIPTTKPLAPDLSIVIRSRLQIVSAVSEQSGISTSIPLPIGTEKGISPLLQEDEGGHGNAAGREEQRGDVKKSH